MSTPLALTVTRPLIFEVMGDYMYPEVLARVAKASKAARTFITPILEKKKEDKDEMYNVIHRLFPGISFVRGGGSASYYIRLLQKYFESRVHVPKPVMISHMVAKGIEKARVSVRSADITVMVKKAAESKQRILDPRLAGELCYEIRSAMNSPKGRRLLLQSIRDWEEALMHESDGLRLHDAYALRIMEECILLDFSIRFDEIGI